MFLSVFFCSTYVRICFLFLHGINKATLFLIFGLLFLNRNHIQDIRKEIRFKLLKRFKKIRILLILNITGINFLFLYICKHFFLDNLIDNFNFFLKFIISFFLILSFLYSRY